MNILENGVLGKALAMLAAFAMLLGASTQASATALNDVSFASLSGDRVQVNLKFSEPLQEKPVNFTIDNPARIAIDLPGVDLNMAEKSQSIGLGMALSLSAVEAAGRTRVVVNLVRPVSYDMNMDGDTLVLTLGSGASGAGPERAGGADASSSVARIDNIDFRRGDHGEGRVVVTLSDPSIGVNLSEEGGKIVADFLGTSLPSELDRRLNVVDFATPVKEIDTSAHGNGARMVISTTTDQYEHIAYQSDNVFTIEVQPLSKEEQEAAKREKFGYTGERLSLNFQNIEVRAVLQLIADFTGFNLVASDTVGGSVTLRLKNVPWDQALDIILKSRGLGMRKSGNVMMIAPQEEIAAREKLELESNKQVEDLAPLRTEFIAINYAKASDLATLISKGDNSLLSERGTVSIDARTNTLIVQDVSSSLQAIRDMIAKLDVPVRQVMIESRIVNADESFTRDLGVQFGFTKSTGTPSATDQEISVGSNSNLYVEPTVDNFMVSLPVVAPSASIGLAVGKIASYLLQLELSALLAEGRGEDIASPKVITANQKEALIESGVEIPYQEASSSGATSVSFKKAVLALKVVPQITPDNRVLLDLSVNQDTRGSPDVLGVPPIDTRAVTTQVLVNDGETVVLGGIYSQTDRNNVDRVPFFSELPYLGYLFKKNRIEKSRRELLIFVTPKILKEEMSI